MSYNRNTWSYTVGVETFLNGQLFTLSDKLLFAFCRSSCRPLKSSNERKRKEMSKKWHAATNMNLLARCWFILALGATPSTARKKTFFGRIILNNFWKPPAVSTVCFCLCLVILFELFTYINVGKNVWKNLLLWDPEFDVVVIGVRAVVNNSVHIQI